MPPDWENFSKQIFLADFENWNQILQLNQNNVNLAFNKLNYLSSINFLINSHNPLKKLSKKKRKFQKKSWITKDIQNSIH